MSDWSVKRLGDLVTFRSGGTPRKSDEMLWSGDIPWISGATLSSPRVTSSDQWVSSQAIGNGTRIAFRGSVLILVRGMSLHREIRVGMAMRDLAFNQDVKALEASDQIYPDFLLYALLGRRNELLSLVHAAGHGTGVLSTERLRDLSIALPGLDEQKRIATVLGAFDDLIETNRSLIGPLSEAARREGQRMLAAFADREPVALTDYCTITKGFSYRSSELELGADTLVNLKNIGRGGTFQERGYKPLSSSRFKEAQVVSPGEVVVALTDLTQQREVVARPVRVPRSRVEGRMVASLDLAVVRPSAGHEPEFIVAVLAQDDFHSFAKNYSNGTTVLHMSTKAFDDYTIPRIDPVEARPYTEKVGRLNEACDDLADEIADLTRVRDELLPLLMSGRIRVSEAEDVLEEVAS